MVQIKGSKRITKISETNIKTNMNRQHVKNINLDEDTIKSIKHILKTNNPTIKNLEYKFGFTLNKIRKIFILLETHNIVSRVVDGGAKRKILMEEEDFNKKYIL